MFRSRQLFSYLFSATLQFVQSKDPTIVDPVEAHRLAKTLRQHNVRCVIMNACQSAAGINNYSRTLVQEGIPTVIGMQYQLLQSAAEIMSTALYQHLLVRGSSLPEACSYARSKLREFSHRGTNYNTSVEVCDYLNPVIFTSERFQEWKCGDIENSMVTATTGVDVEEGLLGRDTDLLRLENEFLAMSNLQYLTGPAGTGKTALVQHVSWWWTVTGLISGVLRVDFATTQCETWEKVLQSLLAEVRDRATTSESQLIDLLRTKRYLVVFDSLDALPNPPPKALVTGLVKFAKTFRSLERSNSASLVLFIGRRTIGRLQSFVSSNYVLNGMNMTTSLRLAFKLLDESPRPLKATDFSTAGYMKQIVLLMEGNPLAIDLLMSDFALRSDSISEYYYRLTSCKSFTISTEEKSTAASHRAAQKALDLSQSDWTFKPIESLPGHHMVYLSPFWRKIPAQLSGYWKFLGLASRRVNTRPTWSYQGLHDARTAAEAMDLKEVELLYDNDVVNGDFLHAELEELDNQFMSLMDILCNSGFVNRVESIYLTKSHVFDHYWIHPLLTLCLRAQLEDETTARAIITPAFQRFYGRRDLLSWPDTICYDFRDPAWENANKQINYELENYVTAVNFTYAIKLSTTNYKCLDTGHIIAAIENRNTRDLIVAHGLHERGIDYWLAGMKDYSPGALIMLTDTLVLWKLKLGRKLMSGLQAATADIDDGLTSWFCIFGVMCLESINSAARNSYRLGLVMDRYHAALRTLEAFNARGIPSAIRFNAMLDATKRILHGYANPVKGSGLSREEIDTVGTLLGADMEAIRNSRAALENLPLPAIGETEVKAARQAMRKLQIKYPNPLLTSLEDIIETDAIVNKAVLCILQGSESPAQAVDLYYNLAWLATYRPNLRLAREYVGAIDLLLYQLPLQEEPWLGFTKLLDIERERLARFVRVQEDMRRIVDEKMQNHEFDMRYDEDAFLLCWAAEEGREEVIRKLIQGGVNAGSKDRYGRTAVRLAAANGHQDIVNFLLGAGAKVEPGVVAGTLRVKTQSQ